LQREKITSALACDFFGLSPFRDLALFFADKVVPNFPVFGFVAIILEFGHLTADIDQGVQLR
jgi:hypothetical protein